MYAYINYLNRSSVGVQAEVGEGSESDIGDIEPGIEKLKFALKRVAIKGSTW